MARWDQRQQFLRIRQGGWAWLASLGTLQRMQGTGAPTFVYPVTVRLYHTDAAGVMFCSRLLELAHEAYEALLEREGLGLDRILAQGSYRLPVVALEAEFLRPIGVGVRLQVELTLTRRGAHSYQVAYQFRDPAGEVRARAVTRYVALDGSHGKPTALPEALARIVGGAGGTAV